MGDLTIMDNTFIDTSTFVNQVQEYKASHREPVGWMDIPTGVIFKIISVERVMFSWGASQLITALDIHQIEIRFWAPRSMSNYIRDHQKKGRLFFFQSQG